MSKMKSVKFKDVKTHREKRKYNRNGVKYSLLPGDDVRQYCSTSTTSDDNSSSSILLNNSLNSGGNGRCIDDLYKPNAMIEISRPALNWERYEKISQPEDLINKEAAERVRDYFYDCCECSAERISSTLLRLCPVLSWLPFYKIKEFLLPDIISGLTVGIMNVPQGMAYAMLASLPPVYGLYTSFYPCLFYFLFGTARHASFGTFAITSLMTSQVIDQIQSSQIKPVILGNSTIEIDSTPIYSNTDIAATIALVVGLIQIVMGMLHLGSMVVYMSAEMVSGFFMACGVYVFTSQISTLFGIKFTKHTGVGSLIMNYIEFFKHLMETNTVVLGISICSIVVLLFFKLFIDRLVQKKIPMQVPIDLLIIIIVTVLSTYCNFESSYNVESIGEVPTGIKVPMVPKISVFSLQMLPMCFSLAFIMFATSVSVSIVLSKKHKYTIDSNQELFAYGLSCFGSSFFHCFPSSISMSRSLLTSVTGGKTLLASVVSAIMILTVIIRIGTLFEHLPKCVLSAIIVVALKNTVKEFEYLKKTWKISKLDAAVWLVSFSVTVLVDIQFGLITSIIFSLLLIILRSQWANSCVLGNIPNTELYVDITKYKAAMLVPGISIIHFGSSLNFSNSQYFLSEVYKLTMLKPCTRSRRMSNISTISATRNVSAPPTPIISRDGPKGKPLPSQNTLSVTNCAADGISIQDIIHTVIIDMSCIGNIDATGVHTFSQLSEELFQRNISLSLAACSDPVLMRLLSLSDNEIFLRALYPTVHDAVLTAQS